MSKKLRKKAVLMIAIEIISIVLLGIFLRGVQTNLSVSSQKKDTKEKLAQVQQLVENGKEDEIQTTETFDEIFSSKAASLSFMARNEAGFAYTDGKMKELKELFEVTNVAVLDREGNVIAGAEKTAADFTYDRYNQLRTVFDTGTECEPMEVTTGEHTYRYYAANIDADKMVVIEQDPEELYTLLDETSTWKGVLSNVSVGLDGYAFAISSKNYTFLYHPEEDLIEQDALDAGVLVEDLENNNYTWMEINGERLYCGVTQIDDAYVVCAVTAEEINASRTITVGIVLFAFFTVMTILIIYAILMMRDEENSEQRNKDNFKKIGGFYYNKAVGRKIGTLATVGLILILIISVYMQTLFSLSRQSMSSNQHVKEVQKTINRNKKEIQLITEQYNERYLNKCQVAAYILSESPKLADRDSLGELSKALDVEFIYVFDENGVATSTSSSYTKFQVSDNEEDQSYEFNRLLQGGEYLIQEARRDDVSGEYRQYIGVTTRDEAGDVSGFVQVAISPKKLSEALATTDISSVLEGIKVGARGFAFAVDKEHETFAYFPKERLIGKNAKEYGMSEEQFIDEYCDYLLVGTDKYYGSSLETDNYYIYLVVPETELVNNRIPTAAVTTAASLIFILIVFFMLTLSRKQKETDEKDNEKKDGPMIDIVMPDGSRKKTEAAASRWTYISIKWSDKTPEQQIFSVLRGILSVLALAICVVVLLKDSLVDSNSILLYVLNGTWRRGMNIFALTGSIMIICVASVLSMIVRKILMLLSQTFGARGETVCRLLNSFVKYITVLIMLYYCLALFGVDTKTLLASAGILSLVVGLGAKELISDILAGLFIIFEGEFRVGDIVTIGDWRGTVLEIGIRTTKIEDPSKNIKIVSNSEVSGVVNMTKRCSYAFADVGIEYGESLERVENILEKELPNIRKRISAIQDGPFYKGVVELGESSVNLRVMAQCAEGDRVQVGRDLNREMKLLFDKYDINIPFPQVVLNQPSEFIKATEYEKRRADEFNKKQKELSKELGNEEEEH